MISILRTFLAIAWRNLWRNYRRTGITLVVVSVGLWSIIFFNSFLNAWIQSGKDEALGLLTASGQIHAIGFLDDPGVERMMAPPDSPFLGVLNSREVAHWAPRVVIPGVVQSEYKTLPINVVGVDPGLEATLSTIPGKVVEGRYLADETDDGVVLGLHLVERLNTGLGRRVILMAPGLDGTLSEQSFDVVGLFDADNGTEDLFAFTGLGASQEFLGLEDQISQIVVAKSPQAVVEDLFRTIETAAPDLDVRTWKELNLLLAATDTSMRMFIYIWLGVVFSLVAIGIINTQLMAVFERTQEFGLLRALGMKPRFLVLMVVMESAMLVGAGVVVGIVIAIATIASLSGGVDLSGFARAMEMFQGGQTLYLGYHFEGVLLFSALIWGLGVLVTLWPARRAAKSSPVDAMHRRT